MAVKIHNLPQKIIKLVDFKDLVLINMFSTNQRIKVKYIFLKCLWLVIKKQNIVICARGAKSRSKVNFKVRYNFSTNKGKNKCNTSFSFNFDWKIKFLYYCHDFRSISRSKGRFQDKVNINVIFNKYSLQHV